MDGNKIKVLNNSTPSEIKHYLKMFEGMTLENVEEIRKKHTQVK